MKKIFLLILTFVCSINIVTATQRYNIASGVYVLQDKNQFTVVDDNQHVCFIVSIELDRMQRDAYQVVCGTESRAAVKTTLNTVITASVINAFNSGGASLLPAVKAEIVKIIYNMGCDYWSRYQ
ncbi:MAG: hypothetical protein J1F10_06930 [Muribaculaceae bacterium]|nr:hypothetical protein [Muribaculaceae bacterium]